MDQNVLAAIDLWIMHDAELCLVEMERQAATLRLGFKGADQAVRSLSFHGVVTQRIDNLQFQNVVSRILVSGTDVQTDGDIERILRWTSSVPGLARADHRLMSEQQFPNLIAGVHSGDLRLICVEPSWGAEIGIVAERFNFSDEPL